MKINPKIPAKFADYNLPSSYVKMITKILTSQTQLDKDDSSQDQIISTFNKILTEVIDDKDIEKYIFYKSLSKIQGGELRGARF